MDKQTDQQLVSRRGFLAGLMGGFGAFIAAVVGIPAIGFSLSPTLKSTKKQQWVQAGLRSDFQTGTPKMVQFTMFTKDGWMEQSVSKSVWVVRNGDSDFTVFNPRCTHLGCIVSWKAEDKDFHCPCHGGVYSIAGKVLGGPPPRPLDRLDWKLDGEKLMVSYEDFRLGVPNKIEA